MKLLVVGMSSLGGCRIDFPKTDDSGIEKNNLRFFSNQ